MKEIRPENLPNSLPDALPDAVFVVEIDGSLSYANQMCVELFGWDLDRRIGSSMLDLIHPDDVFATMHVLTDVAAKSQGSLIEARIATASGDWKRCELRSAQLGSANALAASVFVARDVTERTSSATSANDSLLRAILERSTSMIVLMNPDGRTQPLNDSVSQQLGYDPELIDGAPFSKWLAEGDRQRVLQDIVALAPNATVSLEALFLRSDGTEVPAEFTVTNLVHNQEVQGYLIAAQTSSPLREARNRIDFLAMHDAMTGLLNRKGFNEEANKRLVPLALAGQRVSVLLFDLDRMTQINELLGESVGDRVVALVASRVELAIRSEDIVGRYAGDEFVVGTAASPDTILMLKERLLAVIAQPMNIDGHDLRVTASCAVASGTGRLQVDTLVTEATSRLKVSKNSKPGSSAVTADALAERRTVVEQLRLGVDRAELTPWFQPIVNADGTTLGYEALIRWMHPSRGVLTPAAFLPLITLAGLDQRLEEIVMNDSLSFLSLLVDRGHNFMTVHVNVSPRQLSNEDFGRKFLASAERAMVPLSGLCVEITESDLLHVGASAINNLSMLRRAGVHVAMDDFGTGYSSLSHLLELPVDCLKIDRRFVDGLGVDPTATGLTKAILSLTESMHINCVAEGVELRSQHDRLVEFGCPQYQGWLYAPALDVADALAFNETSQLDLL